ncbi:hypothetical protein CDL15_Pgr026297 [Punica granatum]|uniref:Uncharacterized protein n=1 Tax=Punica granatum TaxID=22663 RepID=A0A218XVZ4_PUNGR|nr:hypothetical protein CDL15_Pgr026297 [Punica granatum]
MGVNGWNERSDECKRYFENVWMWLIWLVSRGEPWLVAWGLAWLAWVAHGSRLARKKARRSSGLDWLRV